ncbi:aspartate 4-decarboxylase [Endozoicomonas sp. OPT23]|uniref:bifunctional aspartate transaminase/aspartate 4-decarboxylase n=1 Tax=Endozoicomonas sp. OPT23 TaxID=2072845 RepID=UPI00129A2CE9|nr:bifunctional aspartate transaminase/aspartate 4-decarboxylase [Endozoicomonas sp. OPT23]MRI34579.1 aspartate 4-decarboxylase [Endozoicomonas sp. OPT23]
MATSDLFVKDSSVLSPFEFKDQLLDLASSHADRMMLNAGRGNPNFLAIAPRRAFLQLSEFALQEAERSYSFLHSGFGGLPEASGILGRFESYMQNHHDSSGMNFIRAALCLVNDHLGIEVEAFLFEMVNAALGCYYPEPVSMLKYSEAVVKEYLQQELMAGSTNGGDFRLFATEGGTAAMSYLFHSLKTNQFLGKGDFIAIVTPVFAPYLEIPELDDYKLYVNELVTTDSGEWQLSDEVVRKLANPAIKMLCLVNPANPSSFSLSRESLNKIKLLVETDRPDLIIVTDDVYGPFADNFCSLFKVCPENTLCVYSFSKYFGCTGWRLGVIAIHKQSLFNRNLATGQRRSRYRTVFRAGQESDFIDRMVADSRAVALHHSAGLSTPQQLQMVLFALSSLIDSEGVYQREAQRLIRSRLTTLYKSIGIEEPKGAELVGYYTLLDLQQLATSLYNEQFSAWFIERHSCSELLLTLADETGVVLLPGEGFDVKKPAVRVSLANLTLAQYKAIGVCVRKVLAEFYQEFTC